MMMIVPQGAILGKLNKKGDHLFYDEELSELQLKSGDSVLSAVAISGGSGGSGGGITLAPPTQVSLSNLDEAVSIKWTDPADVTLDGAKIAKWTGTLVVRKVGAEPQSRTDGVVVVDSKTRNQYAENGFTDNNLTNGETYYYGVFPYTDGKAYTYGTTASIAPAAIYPSAPTVTSVTAESKKATVAFTKPDNATGVRIVWKAESEPTSEIDGTYADTSASPYEITGLTNDVVYYVKVYSYNAKGRYAAGGAISATPSELSIVPWATGSYEDIKKMLDAHYAGRINIEDYWAVGDIRYVTLGAMRNDGQIVTSSQPEILRGAMIIGFNHDNLTTPINERTKAAVTVDFIKNLQAGWYINRYSVDGAYSWKSSNVHKKFCPIYVSALEPDLRDMIKTVNKENRYYGNDIVDYTQDNAFLLSEWEYTGNSVVGKGKEGEQYQYYKGRTPIKYSAYSTDIVKSIITRSPAKVVSGNICYVGEYGAMQYTDTGREASTPLAFCI